MSKTAFISGGSRGIGRAIAKGLAQAGFKILFNGVKDKSQVNEQLEEYSQFGETAEYIQGDIGNAADRESMISQIKQATEQLEVVINNAGVAPQVRNDILEVEETDFDYVLDINLKGTFFLSQQLARMMIQHQQAGKLDKPSMIFISSISSHTASINRAAYCISKSGISILTQLLTVRLAPENIAVYEIRPGVIKTDMTEGVLEKYQKQIEDGLTLEPRIGQPEDIAKITTLLAKGEISYATGQVFIPDGGMHIQRL